MNHSDLYDGTNIHNQIEHEVEFIAEFQNIKKKEEEEENRLKHQSRTASEYGEYLNNFANDLKHKQINIVIVISNVMENYANF